MHPNTVSNAFTTTFQLKSHNHPMTGSQRLSDIFRVTKIAGGRART